MSLIAEYRRRLVPWCCRLWLAPFLLVRGPKSQVVTQQLHDQRRVLVRVLGHVVKLCNGILKSSARHLACLIWIAQDLVLEDRVVQGKPKANWVGHRQILLG